MQYLSIILYMQRTNHQKVKREDLLLVMLDQIITSAA